MKWFMKKMSLHLINLLVFSIRYQQQKSAIFVIIDSNGVKTDFYLGVRSLDEDRTTSSMKNTLENSMAGQFPGIKTTNYTIEEIQDILSGVKGTSISSVTCVAIVKRRVKTRILNLFKD